MRKECRENLRLGKENFAGIKIDLVTDIASRILESLSKRKRHELSQVSLREIVRRDRPIGVAKRILHDLSTDRFIPDLTIRRLLKDCHIEDLWVSIPAQQPPGQHVVVYYPTFSGDQIFPRSLNTSS